MSKYRMKFDKTKIVIFLAIALVCLGAATANFVIMGINAGNGSGVAWHLVVAAIIMILIAFWAVYTAFFSKYIIKKGMFKLSLGGISTYVNVSDILLIRTNPEKTVWVLYYKFFHKKSNSDKIGQLNLTAYDPQGLCDALLNANGDITFEIFDKNAGKE